MTDKPNIEMSQGLVVLPPRADQAYPIPCEEWALLKSRVQKLTSEPWLYQTIGSLLLGAALSALGSIITGTFQLPEQQRALDLAWLVFFASGVTGLVCLGFAHKERGVHRDRASDIVAQMDLIEKRFDRASP